MRGNGGPIDSCGEPLQKDDSGFRHTTVLIVMTIAHSIATLLRRGTILVSLLAFMLAGLVGVSWVLCVGIGGDGHIALESVEAQPHPGATAPSHPDLSVESTQTCVDLPAIESTTSSPPKPDDLPVAPLLALLCLLWPLLPSTGRAPNRPKARRGRDPRLIHHRTTVLLN